MSYNIQIGKSKIKLLTEYESVTQKVVICNAVFMLYVIKYFELQFYIP
jgi:hypothetical protein